MKRSLRTIAAVLAAVTAMSCAALPAYAVTSPDIAVTDTDADVVGGWEVLDGSLALSKNPDAKKAFKKAVKKLDSNISLSPIAVLATQVVAGTNYAVLCRANLKNSNAIPSIDVVYVYADLQGDATVIGYQTIIGGEQLMGGYTPNKGKFSMSNNKTVNKCFKKAMKGLVGVSYKAVAYLGSQVVAGKNYLVLCRSKAVTPKAKYKYSLVTVYKDLQGKVSLGEINDLRLGDMNYVNENN